MKWNRRLVFHSRRVRACLTGTVAAYVGVTLPLIIGVTSMAPDGGMQLSSFQSAQGLADASALSAAYILYNEYPTNKGKDSKGNAAKAANSRESTATIPISMPRPAPL